MTLPTFRLDGKVAVVTGGSRGLGRAISFGLAESGATVVVASRKLEACEEVASEIRSLGGTSMAVACHVGDWDGCESLVKAVVAEFGRIDVLVNNAGIAPAPPSLAGITEELFDKTVAVNLKGPLRLIGLAAEYLPVGASVINISSLASMHPSPHTIVYAAAKAGLNAVTKAASQELGPRGVRVNAIVCGSFHSDAFDRSIPTPEVEQMIASRISLRRIADADEVVGTAIFLASEASTYMTGALLALDGGGP